MLPVAPVTTIVMSGPFCRFTDKDGAASREVTDAGG